MQYSSDSDSDPDNESQDNSSGIDLDSLGAIKKVESTLAHQVQATGSVLSLAADNDILFAGLQGGAIAAWRLDTFELLRSVKAHENSVLSLHLAEDQRILFSGGADSTIGVWSADTLQKLSTIVSHHDVGDIFCISYSAPQNFLFCGTQSQAIQWHHLQSNQEAGIQQLKFGDRKHKFFDSLPRGQQASSISTPEHVSHNGDHEGKLMAFRTQDIITYAHDSFVTCMLLIPGLLAGDPKQEILLSGGADGCIKFWSFLNDGFRRPRLIDVFKNRGLGVLSIAYKEPFLYAGMTGGQVRVFSMESRRLVQKIFVCSSDITTIQVIDGAVFCGTSDGLVKRFNSQFTEVGRWQGSTGKILASVTGRLPDQEFFITGANDNTIAFWDVGRRSAHGRRLSVHGNDEMLRSLRDLIAFKTISAQPQYASSCDEAASFLRKLCNVLQAETSFLPSDGRQISPILLAKFKSTDSKPRKRILFYGHYDVVDAEEHPQHAKKWVDDPFKLRPHGGYLYGRGVSDNKGPILAALYAAAELVQQKALPCDVIFLLEGQEEAGSVGFEEAVRANKSAIGKVDHVLIANSYWHDDHVPCLTYGMRGVIHATVRVESDKPDRHSGMDGRAAEHEPLKDLAALLGTLVGSDATHVMIPGFYDGLIPTTEEEKIRYQTIADTLMPFHPEIKNSEKYTTLLQQKWSIPNLSYHQIETPEPKSAVTIARSAEAPISIRLVPGQSASSLSDGLVSYLKESFANLDSSNRLRINIAAFSDAWLGDPNNTIFSTLSAALSKIWRSRLSAKREFKTDSAGVAIHLPKSGPLFIREGGSIPAIGFLEKEFRAPAAMFPCGQSSDNAHLDNERIRVENLHVAREVFREVFTQLPNVAETRGHKKQASKS